MIRPAVVDDLYQLVVRGTEAHSWLAVLAAPNLPEVIKKNKIVVAVDSSGIPYACVGVGELPLAGIVVPWVWAVVDVDSRPQLRFFIKNDLQSIRSYLDENAYLAYTAPEKNDPTYSRFLAWIGFRQLGWGLWQWPSSARLSQG